MKRIYSFALLLLSLVLFPELTQAMTKVELMGNLLAGQTRIMASAMKTPSVKNVNESISAYNFSSGVYTAFNDDLGYVLIEVVSADTEQVVYSSFVDSGYEDSFIPMNRGFNLNSGGYYIRYNSLYGDLEGDLQ